MASTAGPVTRIKIAEGLSVSPVCVGWVSEPGLVVKAFESGINFFFLTADMHWPRYEATRRGLESLLARVPRQQLVIAAASYVTQPDFCHTPFRELIQSVEGLGSLDITIMGGVYAADFAIRRVQFGLHRTPGDRRIPGVTAVGASFHDRSVAVLAANSRLVDIGFIRYNPLHPGAQSDLFPALSSEATVLYNFNCRRGYIDDERWAQLGLGNKRWRPRLKDYYRFSLRIPHISGLLISLWGDEDVANVIAAMREPCLTEDEASYMIRLADIAAGRTALDG